MISSFQLTRSTELCLTHRGYTQGILSPQRLGSRDAGRMPFNGRAMIRLPRKLEKNQAIGFELLLFRV